MKQLSHQDDDLEAFREAVAARDWNRAAEILQSQSAAIVPKVALRLGSGLRGSQGAEDVFANTIAKILTQLVNGEELTLPQLSLRAWLFTATLRCGIDVVRRTISGRQREQEAASKQNASQPRGDEALRQAECLRGTLALLGSKKVGLSPKEVVILKSDLSRHFQLEDEPAPRSDDELASELKIAKQRLWNLRCRARARLAAHLPEVLGNG